MLFTKFNTKDVPKLNEEDKKKKKQYLVKHETYVDNYGIAVEQP